MTATRQSNRIFAVASVFVLTAAFGPTRAQGHYNIGYHTVNNCNETNIVDPVNIAFAGSAAFFGRVSEVVKDEVGWEDQSTGSGQSIFDHNTCQSMNDQRKLGTTRGHHTRLFQMDGFDNHDRYITVGDAHQERATSCGDATYEEINGRTGFDDGAREVLQALGQRYFDYMKKPNRQRFRQCNGDEPGWNGRQLFFQVDDR